MPTCIAALGTLVCTWTVFRRILQACGRTGLISPFSFRSRARAFLRYVETFPALDPKDPIEGLSSSVSADFKAWLSGAEHHGPDREGAKEKPDDRGYSPSTQKLYLAALARLLKF